MARTLRSLAACRTPALGGHITRCRQCGEVNYHYHSCGNRHCPACGGYKRAAWLARRQADLLPVPYFHVVFTLPHQLSGLILGNRGQLYRLLFDAAAQTLLQVAADPKHLGARIGILAVLHTWGQQLEHHPHVHCVVPGGGLALAGGSPAVGARRTPTPLAEPPRWVSSRPAFFLPVKVLGRVFRGKYLAGLRQAYAAGTLTFAGSTAALADPATWQDFLRGLYALNFVVYAKEPFGGPAQVLKYLAQYTHRAAISNARLVRLHDGQVTFTWKDYANGCQRRHMSLDGLEFVRRFALHLLPKGLVRIRQYGLLANRSRGARLTQCRALLATQAGTAAGDGPAPAPCRSGLWLGLCLLAGLLLLGFAESQQGTPPTLADVVAAIQAAARCCPACGVGDLEIVWHADRPTGRQLACRWHWDTS